MKILILTLFVHMTIANELFHSFNYEVRDPNQTVELIAKDYYGYSFFGQLIREFNRDKLQDQTEILSVGISLRIPHAHACILYYPISCVDYFNSTESKSYYAKGLPYQETGLKQTAKFRGEGRFLVPITKFDKFRLGLSFLSIGASIFLQTVNLVWVKKQGVLGEPPLTYDIIFRNKHSIAKLKQPVLTDNSYEVSCDLPLILASGQEYVARCFTTNQAGFNFTVTYTYTHGNESFKMQTQISVPNPAASQTPSIKVNGKLAVYQRYTEVADLAQNGIGFLASPGSLQISLVNKEDRRDII